MTKGVNIHTRSIFVTCRTQSSRLPGKALLEVSQGVLVIEHVLRRAQLAGNSFPVVLCTTNEKSDDILVEIANREGVSIFRGSTNDKLMRWLSAAKYFGVEYFATFDADDLFCSPKIIGQYLTNAHFYNQDLVQATGVIPGIFTYGIRVAGLERVCRAKTSKNTEMMWEFFKNTQDVSIGELEKVPRNLLRQDMRFTLDYIEDFEFFKEVFLALGYKADLDEEVIVEFLHANPQITKINYFRQQDYIANQSRIILKERGQH